MKKKLTEDELAEKELTEEELAEEERLNFMIYKGIEEDCLILLKDMQRAEKDLVNTLTDEQMEIYDDFCEKREEFYRYARALYRKIF